MSVTSSNTMGRAISDVVNNGMTTNAAAQIHGVSRSTLAKQINLGKKISVTSSDTMGRAISDVVNNGMTTNAAARIHGVSRSTLAKRINLKKKELESTKDDSEFMKNFDPANSKRSCKKQTKMGPNNGPQKVYNRKGRLVSTGLDLCDCLSPNCVGCFFACPKCRSYKCGHECRQNRKWTYDCYEVQGTGTVINQKYDEGAADE